MDKKKKDPAIEELTPERAADGEFAEVEILEPEKTETASEDPLSQNKSEIEAMNDRLLRLQADFDNFRRRTRQEKEEMSTFVTQRVIERFLPVIDNFERALASKPSEDASGFSSGVDMIFRQFGQVLEQSGVTAIEVSGKMFDPAQHEAVATVADTDQPEGMIVEEMRKGYLVGGKVLRPAMVKVSGGR